LSLKAKPLFTRGRNSAVRNKDGWLVVNEYESDDLASRFEDEKKLRKAKESASRKRKVKFDGRRNEDNKPQYAADNQLFRALSDRRQSNQELQFGSPAWRVLGGDEAQ